MSSYLPGAGRNTATTAAATYGFDLEIELRKSTTASVRASSYSSSPPSSTISESSNSLSPALSICTRKTRTPRKRPNQTYSEAAALLSTAYPNVFSPKYLAKPPSFKFAKPTDSATWLNSAIGEELLLPEKPFEPRLGLVSTSSCSNYSDTSSERPCQSPMEDNGAPEDDDFDTNSFLDEEIGGIDSIMGNLTVRGDNNQHQQTSNFCYGLPMGLGLGLGLLGGRFDFGFGITRGVRALRNSPNSRYGAAGEGWRYPAMTTVDVEAISPTLEKKPAVEKKKTSGGRSKKKKVKETEASIAAVPAESISDCRIRLKLNYDDVLSAWSDRGSPFSDDSPASELRGSDVRVQARLAQIDLLGEGESESEREGAREASVQRYKDKPRRLGTKLGRLTLINRSE